MFGIQSGYCKNIVQTRTVGSPSLSATSYQNCRALNPSMTRRRALFTMLMPDGVRHGGGGAELMRRPRHVGLLEAVPPQRQLRASSPEGSV